MNRSTISGIAHIPEWQSTKQHDKRPCLAVASKGAYLLVIPLSTRKELDGEHMQLSLNQTRACGFRKRSAICLWAMRWIHVSEFTFERLTPSWIGKRVLSWLLGHTDCIPEFPN